jgi:hypothetical protein
MSTAKNIERFLMALDVLAPADAVGFRVFRERGVSVSVAVFSVTSEGFVSVNSLVSLPSETRDGKRVALAGVNFLADLFDVTLIANDSVLIRDISGNNEDTSWLAGSGFLRTAGESHYLRLPQSIHRIAA